MTVFGQEDTKQPNDLIPTGSPGNRAHGASARGSSTVKLVAVLGGIGLEVLCIQGLQLSGFPILPPLPEHDTAAKVLSRAPDPECSGLREGQATLALARYYALSLRPRATPAPVPLHAPRRVVSRPAEAIVAPAPAYPVLARKLGAKGVVDVTVLVDETGFPATLSSDNGPPALQKAALDAATGWRFRPATENGKPVKGTFTIHFEFKLRPIRI